MLNLARTDLIHIFRGKVQSVMSKLSSKFNWRKFDRDQFALEHVEVSIPNLPKVFKNYCIVHVSDIHYGQWVYSDRLSGVINIINEIHPDLIAITGDFVSYIIDENIEAMSKQLEKLKPKDLTVAVLGNHDHWGGAEKVRRILEKSHIRDLSNDILAIDRAGYKLYVAGLDSVTVKKERLDLILDKLPLEGPAILLVHEPDFAVKSALTKRFSLQLSGHSHGGQFIIPGFGTPFRGDLFRKHPAGYYNVEGMSLYTNRGLGTNGYWLRVNCKPEITIITLV